MHAGNLVRSTQSMYHLNFFVVLSPIAGLIYMGLSERVDIIFNSIWIPMNNLFQIDFNP